MEGSVSSECMEIPTCPHFKPGKAAELAWVNTGDAEEKGANSAEVNTPRYLGGQRPGSSHLFHLTLNGSSSCISLSHSGQLEMLHLLYLPHTCPSGPQLPFSVALVQSLVWDIQEESVITEKAVPVGRGLRGEAEMEV